MLRPRSIMSTLRPASVSSLAAQPPVIPEPTTMASNSVVVIGSYPKVRAIQSLDELRRVRRQSDIGVEATRHQFIAELLLRARLRGVVTQQNQRF